MKITDAKYTRRYNLGDYEHEEYSLSGLIEDGCGTKALVLLKKEVEAAFSTDSSAAVTEEPQQPKQKAKKGKKDATKNAKPDHANDEDSDDESSEEQDAGSDDEGYQDNEAADSEDDDNSDDSSDSDEAATDEDEEEQVTASKKRAKGPAKENASEGKKSFKKKPQSYNRGIEQHKEIFSSTLRLIAPDWKKDEASKKKAKAASEKLEGVEFLDASGVVLPTFIAAMKKLMGVKK